MRKRKQKNENGINDICDIFNFYKINIRLVNINEEKKN